MGIDYAALAASALSLIDNNGRSMTLVKVSRTPADASKPWRGNTASETPVVVKGVFSSWDSSDVDNDLIRRDDQKCFVSAAAFEAAAPGEEPQDFDFLRDGTNQWKVLRVNKVQPGSTPLLYELQLRK